MGKKIRLLLSLTELLMILLSTEQTTNSLVRNGKIFKSRYAIDNFSDPLSFV
jgi:hypothetical protein